MPEARYVLTGASSGLGQALVRALAADASTRIVGLVTGRREPVERPANASYVVQDLDAPLSAAAEDALQSADRIVHLAWSRPGAGLSPADAAAANTRMTDRVLSIPDAGRRLVFVSSVSASPHAPSRYGRSKHDAQRRVLAAGGTAAVCGLIVGDPPQTAFKTLVDTYRRLPVGIKLIPNTLRVYPVLEADVIGVLSTLVRERHAPGAYRAFLAGGVTINDFIVWMLDRYSIRKPLLPAPLHAGAAGARLARLAGLDGLAEKLATFFFKDSSMLESLLNPPETSLSETEREFREISGRR